MDWIIYALTIFTILICIFFPSLRPERVVFLPDAQNTQMNVTRCIELHNEIVRLGWLGMGHSLEDFQPRTWFEHYGQAAQDVRGELSANVVAFLEGAWELQDGDQSFYWYADGLVKPGDDMFGDLDFEQRLDSGVGRFLKLYSAHDFVGHAEGLMQVPAHTHRTNLLIS